ncbi:Ferredoxin--NAD(+) reductase [Pseudonocardia dioxanivorans CB1190]|uniref:Ferredoxin--NAD(+) reductase n=1 Tax=Pseudonocardia dioxanivorans (strain ATCC 55486 / DSM 44775 / JCM 13855 / CB1190) TaxID=675635 RepID=F4CK59_PSEUX|nr:FAD-dependent oxidoreductase [Pseudonocardia dioxanivorans]AEA28165.1 Ferredoxin--NAD(+) reductase [Pseudonocardia dioxanivorans CB1190]
MTTHHVAIVGAGVAGVQTAEELRRQGYAGRISLISGEEHPPYDRPPLSKEYLTSASPELPLLRPEQSYVDHAIDLQLGVCVTAVDLADRALTTGDGDRIRFDALVLATGSRARRLGSLPRTENVFYLRTLEDAVRLREALRPGAEVVIAGGGFIGLEVAAAARALGNAVTVVQMYGAPLAPVIGENLGRVVQRLHEQRGVTVLTGESVIGVVGDPMVREVATSGGLRLPCDVLVVGVGAEPADELAAAVDLAVDSGILVDPSCRTSAPGVYAVGDVARHDHPVHGRIRVEHWDVARRQAATAAAGILGREEACTTLPWFWSDQYEFNFQYIGHAQGWDDVVVRGDVDAMQFTAFFCRDGRVEGAFGTGRPREIRPAGRLVATRSVLPRELLADPKVDLRRMTATTKSAEAAQARSPVVVADRGGPCTERDLR